MHYTHSNNNKTHTKYNGTVICGGMEGMEIGHWDKKG